ncbi:MAG: hypothetical protein WBE92_01495 [Steroidobacteraceae bacterium]
MRRTRDFEIFSLSFLDCICCGFGAIILLLVISDFRQPTTLEASRRVLAGQVRELTRQLEVIRGETDVLDRELRGRIAELTRDQQALARLAGDLTSIRGEFTASRKEASVTNRIEAQLTTSRQTLNSEVESLLDARRRLPALEAVGGIPIDSNYVIFLVDTSSSMTDDHWAAATSVLREILDLYPHLQGVQILSDRGTPMFGGSFGKWLTDTPALRETMISRMRTWRAYSQSNPVTGIRAAIRTYWSPGRHISLYVLGDEFTGDSIQQALDDVSAVNRSDASGGRLVRIHAVGFLELPGFPPYTSIRFSTLMRLMCEQNGGTFVGLRQ